MDNRKIFFPNYLVQLYLVCRRRRVTVVLYMLKVAIITGERRASFFTTVYLFFHPRL